MSSSFAFGFDDGDEDEQMDASHHALDTVAKPNSIQNEDTSPLHEVQMHALETLLSGLPSYITYNQNNFGSLNNKSLAIPQRDFYDMKAQLMAEDVGLTAIPGLSSQDLEPGVYEGGFKTWECAEDLSSYLSHTPWGGEKDRANVVLELGAGTAMPSCSILQSYLRVAANAPGTTSLRLFLADYNLSVLDVATIPNLLLTWATTSGMLTENGSFEVTGNVKELFLKSFNTHRVSVTAMSGAWSPLFVESFLSASQIRDTEHVLILASETIYSPSSVRQFTSTMMQILRALKQKGIQPSALVATKKIYFGVGGGLDDFSACLKEHGGESQLVWQTHGEGVGRAIVSIGIAGS